MHSHHHCYRDFAANIYLIFVQHCSPQLDRPPPLGQTAPSARSCLTALSPTPRRVRARVVPIHSGSPEINARRAARRPSTTSMPHAWAQQSASKAGITTFVRLQVWEDWASGGRKSSEQAAARAAFPPNPARRDHSAFLWLQAHIRHLSRQNRFRRCTRRLHRRMHRH